MNQTTVHSFARLMVTLSATQRHQLVKAPVNSIQAYKTLCNPQDAVILCTRHTTALCTAVATDAVD
eukprot:3412-Heterococcus_DN1.PRE.2